MTDEMYMFVQDNKEKRSTACSARKQRTHCGKGGSVRLPHDNLTKKELRSMNGEIVNYMLRDPMKWEDFKRMPDDLKVKYIKSLRERFGCDDKSIASMLGIYPTTFTKWIRTLGLGRGKGSGNGNRKWDKEAFFTWVSGGDKNRVKEEKKEEYVTEVENAETEPKPDIVDIPVDLFKINRSLSVPKSGTLTFERGNIGDIMTILEMMLSDNNINATFSWEVVE